jgi:predicted regulator of Ras-like GTPase activity (Roadblock/LC7/MglB family)
MIEGKGRAIQKCLSTLLRTSLEVEGAVLATFDGLLLGSQTRDGADRAAMGGLSALLSRDSIRTTEGLKIGKFYELFLIGTKGYTLVANIDSLALLGVLINRRADLRMVIRRINQTLKELRREIGKETLPSQG